MTVRLTWNGDRVLSRVRAAEKAAVGEITTEAAAAAQSAHPGWHSRTGRAQASIRSEPVTSSATGTRGGIGFGVPYGSFLENDARTHRGDHTLQRAGETRFGDLADRIKKRLQGGQL